MGGGLRARTSAPSWRLSADGNLSNASPGEADWPGNLPGSLTHKRRNAHITAIDNVGSRAPERLCRRPDAASAGTAKHGVRSPSVARMGREGRRPTAWHPATQPVRPRPVPLPQAQPRAHAGKTHSAHSTHSRALPVVAVGELHVHAVAAQEGLAVQGDVHVGRVLDGFAHDDEAGEQGLLVAAETAVRGAVVVDLHLAGAVQDLEARGWGSDGEPRAGRGGGALPGLPPVPEAVLPSRWRT